MRKELSSVELSKALNSLPAERLADLPHALTLAPDNLTKMKLDRFLVDPEEQRITSGQHEFLHEYILGYFGISNSSGEMVRLNTTKPAPALMLGVKDGRYKPDKKLVKFYADQFGVGGVSGGTEQAPNKGKDIPDATDLERLEAMRQQKLEIEERKKKKPITQTLMNFGRS